MVIAHAGHWTVQLLHVAPLLIVLAVLARSSWRDRRRNAASDDHREPSLDETMGDEQ